MEEREALERQVAKVIAESAYLPSPKQMRNLIATVESVGGFEHYLPELQEILKESEAAVELSKAKLKRAKEIAKLSKGTRFIYGGSIKKVEVELLEVVGSKVKVKNVDPPRYVYKVNPLLLEEVKKPDEKES